MYNRLHKFKISHILSRNFLTDSFLPFRLSYKLFKKLNWSKKVHRNGASFTILIKDGMGVMNFISKYETWLDDILPKLIEKEDGVFFDIGANTGQTMIKVLPRFPSIHYLAVEPNEHCVNYLKALCEANQFNSVKIFECALSNFLGEAELLSRYQDDILATTSHSFRKFTKYSTRKTVPQTTGDALIAKENIKEISVIKIDVEGGEANVIDGLVYTIKTFQPYIICEITPMVSKDSGVATFRTNSANQLINSLHRLNYIIVNIVTGMRISGIEDLSTTLESCNYVCVPENKAHLVS